MCGALNQPLERGCTSAGNFKLVEGAAALSAHLISGGFRPPDPPEKHPDDSCKIPQHLRPPKYSYNILWKEIVFLAFLTLSRALSRPFSGILSQASLVCEAFLVLSTPGFLFIDPFPKFV